MRLSIILITWNGKRFLSLCLRSLGFLLSQPDAEIIVVDNGSSNGTTEHMREHYPDIHLIELGYNRGVAYARNRALERAKGDYLWILDNDTEPTEETARGMMEYMDAHPEVGIAGCRLVDADGLVQESCKPYPGIGEKVRSLLHRHGYRYAYGIERMQHRFEPEYLIGACQMFRREAYEKTGELDEKIFYGPEDADFCLRVRAAGYHLVYLPEYTIRHHCQRITRRKLLSPMALKHIHGLLHLYIKYKRFF